MLVRGMEAKNSSGNCHAALNPRKICVVERYMGKGMLLNEVNDIPTQYQQITLSLYHTLFTCFALPITWPRALNPNTPLPYSEIRLNIQEPMNN
jgi:hypothetical protein